MFKNVITFFVLVFLGGCASNYRGVKRISNVEVGPGWSRTMVNATVFRYNSLVSHEEWQYVAYYDSTSTVVIAKRKLGTQDWITRPTSYKGNVLDAHNAITIMVDGEGFLHMAWDHHDNQLNYCRSIQPGSLEMVRQPMIGRNEEKVTYTEFYRMPSGDLIFVYRDGNSGNGNMVMNRYNVKARTWHRVHDTVIDGEGLRNAYWQMCVSSSGTIHLSWVWRETYDVETNHDMCYAVSRDGGATWLTSTGKQYTLPIREATAEYAIRIPQGSDLINQTSITADDEDRPYIATYYRGADDQCPQYYVLYKRNNTWLTSRASTRTMDFDLQGMGSRSIPMSRPQLFFNERQQTLFLLCRDDEYQGAVRLASASIDDMQWSAVNITDYSLARWEPSYDTELWKEKKELHIFLQKVGQGSGEKAVEMKPQPVSILEVVFK